MISLLPIFYLPPISWFAEFLYRNNKILLEQYEHFPKQTYRNRTCIYGANGKLSLIIPILHNGKREMQSIEISYAENWQKRHWKSIKTAYQSSPFFEFYEDQLQEIYTKEEKFLIDYNLKILGLLQSILKTNKTYSLTHAYEKNNAGLQDYREKFSAKENQKKEMESYYQTFSNKHHFIKDLSVLDLICNLGPESLSYLNQIKPL